MFMPFSCTVVVSSGHNRTLPLDFVCEQFVGFIPRKMEAFLILGHFLDFVMWMSCDVDLCWYD